jgi:hypothetical protein
MTTQITSWASLTGHELILQASETYLEWALTVANT